MNKTCDCGRVAFKKTSDGHVCERCHKLETIDFAGHLFCGFAIVSNAEKAEAVIIHELPNKTPRYFNSDL